ncbi:hypothetical protein D3C71_1302420 [compost metagenome]
MFRIIALKNPCVLFLIPLYIKMIRILCTDAMEQRIVFYIKYRGTVLPVLCFKLHKCHQIEIRNQGYPKFLRHLNRICCWDRTRAQINKHLLPHKIHVGACSYLEFFQLTLVSTLAIDLIRNLMQAMEQFC